MFESSTVNENHENLPSMSQRNTRLPVSSILLFKDQTLPMRTDRTADLYVPLSPCSLNPPLSHAKHLFFRKSARILCPIPTYLAKEELDMQFLHTMLH